MTATNDQIDKDVRKVGISLGTTVIGGLLILSLSGLYGFNVVADDVQENTELSGQNKESISEIKEDIASLKTGQQAILRQQQETQRMLSQMIERELNRQ